MLQAVSSFASIYQIIYDEGLVNTLYWEAPRKPAVESWNMLKRWEKLGQKVKNLCEIGFSFTLLSNTIDHPISKERINHPFLIKIARIMDSTSIIGKIKVKNTN